MTTNMNTTNAAGKLWKIQENARVHGLQFAAAQYKRESKKKGEVSNFDVFYFALLGRWPTPRN